MKKVFTLLLIVGITFTGTSQDEKDTTEVKGIDMPKEVEDPNLVKNGSFEDNNGKIKKLGQIDYVEDWSKTTKIKADVFVKKALIPDMGIPTNSYGKASPSDGKSYTGVVAFTQQYKTQKNYFTSTLKKTLVKGKRYCFRMDVSLSDLSKYACNNLGISLTKKDPIDVESKADIYDENRIVTRSNEVIDEMEEWETICVPFTSKGYERFLSVGNFAPERETVTKKVQKPNGEEREQLQMAYYYIDNLELIPIAKDSECTCERDKEEGPNIVYSSASAFDENASVKVKVAASKIYFYPNKAELINASKATLDTLAEVLNSNKSMSISIEGHMDDKEHKKSSEKDYYKDISIDRANSAKEYLIEKGVSPSQLSSKGHKNTKPASKIPSPLNLAKNRRVEFKL